MLNAGNEEPATAGWDVEPMGIVLDESSRKQKVMAPLSTLIINLTLSHSIEGSWLLDRTLPYLVDGLSVRQFLTYTDTHAPTQLLTN